MDVVIVSAVDPRTPKPSGTRSYVMNIIRILSKKGINISLIGIAHDGKLEHTDKGYNFIPIVKNGKISSYRFLFNLLIKAPFLDIPQSAIIHTQRVDDTLPFIFFFRNNPKVLTAHGRGYKGEWILDKGKIISTIIDIIEKFVIKRVDKIIAVDERTKSYYVNNFPRIRDKVIMIPVGIDTEMFKPMDKIALREKYQLNKANKVILYVGRYKKEKGLDLLIKAFRKVQNEIPNCKLVLVGDGPEKQDLLKVTLGLELKDIVFMDPLEHDKIPEIMNCADVFALCSLYEGMPTVVLEALACGVPVVSTDVGGVYKVVRDGKTGYIVKSRTADAIASKLIEALNNGHKFKENCVKMAKEYSWGKITKQIEEVYNNEILKKK